MKKCIYCQTEIDSKAKICPNCKKKQSGIGKWIVIGIVALFVIVAIAGGNSDDTTSTGNNNSSQNQETIEYTRVSKDELDDALENNAAAAKDTYINKYLEITGKLGTIDSDLKYISLMSRTDTWDLNGIHCTLKNDEQRNLVKTLSKDQEITVRGKITKVGEGLGYYLDVKEIIPN